MVGTGGKSSLRISCGTDALKFHLSFHHEKVVLALQGCLLLLVSHTSMLKFILSLEFGLQATSLLFLFNLNYFKALRPILGDRSSFAKSVI